MNISCVNLQLQANDSRRKKPAPTVGYSLGLESLTSWHAFNRTRRLDRAGARTR